MSNKANGPRTVRSPRFPSSKFSAPAPSPGLVHRARLFEALDRGAAARLTLVVGSPGAGKTVLLADWLAARPDRSPAWLSCDSADGDPVRFMAALIEAGRRAAGRPEFGEDARQLLALDGDASADVVAALVDDLEGPGGAQVLAIDDFHLTGGAGADILASLLEYRPPGLQVVVGTRVDPPLRLHRMRTNRELVELRDESLSFSLEETNWFLAEFGVKLPETDVALVHQRSEGWIAGLQMAAISIRESPDPVGAAGRVELHGRTVAGYFLDEVLYRQPPEIVDFMLATAILDELSPAACTALCGETSPALLESVYGSHLLVTRLDDELGTYRYHQLIRDVLRTELHARDPARERALLRRAAQYLTGVGQVGPAARHLLAAGDTTAAFELLSEHLILDFATTPRLGSVFDLDDVEPDLFAGAAEILVPLATELLLRGAFERGSRAVALAERSVVDPTQQPELAMRRDMIRSMHRFLIGEVDEAAAGLDAATTSVVDPEGRDPWVVAARSTNMYCQTWLGHFVEARRAVAAVAAAAVTPPPAVEVLCPGVLSQVAFAEGDLGQADALASTALASAHRLGFASHYFVFTAARTAAMLALERRDLDRAIELTEQSLDTLVPGRPAFDYLAQLDRARIWAAAGNAEDALASLGAARAALRSERAVLLSQADELEARLRVALGDHHGALTATARLPLERRTVLSAIIALHAHNAQGAEEALRDAPRHGATIRVDLELRLLRAAVAALGEARAAPDLIRDCLSVVATHGYLQTVLDTVPQLADHLVSDAGRYPSTESVAALISARLTDRKITAAAPGTIKLPDPLTAAEIRVLEKLPQPLTYADMAADLHVSLNTVKTHLHRTYMKLGVRSRSEAVQRAVSLGLV